MIILTFGALAGITTRKGKKMTKKNDKTNGSKSNIKQLTNQQSLAPLIINTQFVKNLSFRNRNPLGNFKGSGEKPSITINIEAQAHNVSDRTFEVTLRTQVDAKRKDDQVFLLDLLYAGVFTIGKDVQEEFIRPILMIECPRILFPFARNIIATTSQEGGFSPLLLAPVDFAGLYQKQIEQEKAQQEKMKGTIQ